MRSKFLEPSVVSRDNNRQVVGDVSKCLDTTETNNYQIRMKDVECKFGTPSYRSELGGLM